MPDLHTETVTYSTAATELVGYLAVDPTRTDPRPGVIVVHEWWGLDDYIRGRAELLAGLGYTALAADMYGGGKTAENPDGAGALMNDALSDPDALAAKLAAAREVLANHPSVDGERIAAIGYCFGGAVVLHGARTGMDLKVVVSFHGALGSMHTPGKGDVKARILVCHGAADKLVPDEDVAAFKAEMDAAGARYEFKAYDGALHGFTNPQATENGKKYGLPLAYDEAVDRASWSDMKRLFDEAL